VNIDEYSEMYRLLQKFVEEEVDQHDCFTLWSDKHERGFTVDIYLHPEQELK
jgi:hypothetical protein